MGDPWTAPDAPFWKRALAYGSILTLSAALLAIELIAPAVRLWRTIFG